MKLKDFVDICNECHYCVKNNPDVTDPAYTMGRDFERMIETLKENKAIDEVKLEDKEEESRSFFKSLMYNHGYDPLNEDEDNYYTFLQDENVVAKVNVFKPFEYINGEKIFSQKWHTLISWLALLDAEYLDEFCKPFNSYNRNEITEVVVNKTVTARFAPKGRFSINSTLMKQWVFEALNQHQNKEINC
ncbi:MAG: hypothetical protein PHS82_02030 [Lachnospiraceae bacterium]|nr:hypothetical protein [Lachnospiraceae bacterium]